MTVRHPRMTLQFSSQLAAFALWTTSVVALLDGGWAYLGGLLYRYSPSSCGALYALVTSGPGASCGTILLYGAICGIGASLGMSLPAIASYGREHGPLPYNVLLSIAVVSSIFIGPFIFRLVLDIAPQLAEYSEGWLLQEAIPIGFGMAFGWLRNLG